MMAELAAHVLHLSPPTVLLGTGTFGEAWRTERGVLKITRDPLELELLSFGTSHGLRGLPKVLRPPVPISFQFYAYEREDLRDLPTSLRFFPTQGLINVTRLDPLKEVSIAAYDTIVWHDPSLERDMPLITETLRVARSEGALVADLAFRNLGLRPASGETVIRDGRMVKIR